MRVGDIVRIKTNEELKNHHGATGQYQIWPESENQIGVIVALAKRLYIPAAKVMVLGEVGEFDLEELEKVCK